MSAETVKTRVAIDGRYVTMHVTGAQRYATELVERLPDALANPIDVIVPGVLVDRLESGRRHSGIDVPGSQATSRYSGFRGHLWEQRTLPRAFRSSKCELLVGLCNWGPLAIRNQIVAVLDLAPLKHPEFYSIQYRLLTRYLQRRVARRAKRVITLSDAMRAAVSDEYGIPPVRIDVVPPGVGAPFAGRAERGPVLADRSRAYCVFVGGHDPRKNLKFLVDLWPRIHRDLGLELRVVSRGASRPHAHQGATNSSGVTRTADPTDDELAMLYAGALCVLSPSLYEGFGLPLLEGMACGTPFIASDAGAARELAIDPESQVLPLDPDAWVERILAWSHDEPVDLRTRSAERASEFTWEKSADLLADSIRRALEARSG